jgi:hypothetical protein
MASTARVRNGWQRPPLNLPGRRNRPGYFTQRVALTIADFVTNRKVVCVAVAALAERLNVLKRGGFARHVFAAYPARHGAVKLTRNRLVDLVAGKAQSAHV